MKNKENIKKKWKADKKFTPSMTGEERDKLHGGWKKAVDRSRLWEEK